MNITIEGRMDSIEQQLKELRKEMEESVARYKTSFLKPPIKPTKPSIRRIVNEKVINFGECKPSVF